MDLAKIAQTRTESQTATRAEQVWADCQLARQLTEAGDYEQAREVLRAVWPHTGQRPQLDGFDELTAAEVLLRAGTLAAYLGSAKQLAGATEAGKDMLSESSTRFAALAAGDKVVEARTALAHCYWLAGAFDEARVLLDDALRQPAADEQRALALLSAAIVEASAARHADALHYLQQAAPLFAAGGSDINRGRYHAELGIVLDALCAGAQQQDYADRALMEYTAASFHFEQAGHARYMARVENNLALLLYRLARFADAHEHLDRARRLFAQFADAGSVAQVDETRARVLLAEGRAAEAERTAHAAVAALAQSEQQGLLAEALTTHGAALARTGQIEQARATLQRAFDVAEQAGELEGAGHAALVTVEELTAQLAPRELRELYTTADELLKRAQDPALLARLRACARRVLEAAAAVPTVTQLITEANARHAKHVEFTPAAVEALGCLPLAGDGPRLRTLVERTIGAAEKGSVIDAPAVEVVALRQTEAADLNDPWAGFSLKEEVQEFEERLIELALRDARGMVSHAARLLGFKHHETLNWRLKNRNKNLLDARKPIRPRRRSIIRNYERKRA
jgi:tetratricopeptide (TPR) repeat protein